MAAERKRADGDPWCLGYFLGNELGWGNEPPNAWILPMPIHLVAQQSVRQSMAYLYIIP
jgi:hypothetical protein